jgi:hypothetical protein
MTDRNEALWYVGQEMDAIMDRAVRNGISFDDALAEMRFKLTEIEENRDDYEGAA